MFSKIPTQKRTRAPSIDDDIQEIPAPAGSSSLNAKRLRTVSPEPLLNPSSVLHEEEGGLPGSDISHFALQPLEPYHGKMPLRCSMAPPAKISHWWLPQPSDVIFGSRSHQTTQCHLAIGWLQWLHRKLSIEEEVEILPEELEEQARLEDGDTAVDSIAIADDIAEWVETILDDAAPPESDKLHSLATDCLKDARKKKDYRSTVLFAALVNFYHWMPRMGRLRAALRIAKNHGRGPAFQCVLAAQARYFEATGSLKPSHQGHWQKSNGFLDDEGFSIGVQWWLRTLEPGTVRHSFCFTNACSNSSQVNPKLLQQHINETLLPSLSLKKTSASIRHCQRWL
jgi:hypothetical protein